MRLGFRHLVLLWIAGCTGDRSLAPTPTGVGGTTGQGSADAGDAGPIRKIGEACLATVACAPPACIDDPPCWKTCGPAKSGFRNCACNPAGQWLCEPACHYDPGQETSCFALPDPVLACPPDAADPSGMQLPQASGPCDLEPCRPCGSRTAPGYRDSGGVPKVGFCVCVPNAQTGGSTFSCASVSDWPAEQLASPPDETSEC